MLALRWLHAITALLWLLGLLTLATSIWRDWVGPEGRRRIYWWWAAPALYLGVFSGAWLLHKAPALLVDPLFRVKVLVVGGLLVLDHLCQRRLREARPFALPSALLAGGLLATLGLSLALP